MNKDLTAMIMADLERQDGKRCPYCVGKWGAHVSVTCPGAAFQVYVKMIAEFPAGKKILRARPVTGDPVLWPVNA